MDCGELEGLPSGVGLEEPDSIEDGLIGEDEPKSIGPFSLISWMENFLKKITGLDYLAILFGSFTKYDISWND